MNSALATRPILEPAGATRPRRGLRLGNQTAFSAAALLDPFEYALARGFEAFEWFPDRQPSGAGWDETSLDAATRAWIRSEAHAHDIALSVHARWQVNPLDPGAIPLLERDIALADDIGARLVNIHLYGEGGIAAYVRAIIPILERVADQGMLLTIENTPHTTAEEFNEFFRQVHQAAPALVPSIGMCFDLGHANLCRSTLNDYLRYVDLLEPHVPLAHLHLHENWGDRDSHLPLFSGPSAHDERGIRGLLERLQARDYEGVAIFEQWPEPRALLDRAHDRVAKLWHEIARARQSHDTTPSRLAAARGSSVQKQETRSPLAASKTSASLADAPPPTARAKINRPFLEVISDPAAAGRSWRERLDTLRRFLAWHSGALPASELTDIAVYLRFLSTGGIACQEDGRHFRPSHHADIAEEIHLRLEPYLKTDAAFLVRKILPWLPSTAEPFRRAEPLTRIRDIAHRHDIPSELKREIKTQLQNKLHRCAGPEDLATSAALLRRITAPGHAYPTPFVEEFQRFHAELEEFFNARPLLHRLEALLPALNGRAAEALSAFLPLLRAQRLDERSFVALTALRQQLLAGAADATAAPAWRRDATLADIALEEHAFVAASAWIEEIERQPFPWSEALHALQLIAQQLQWSAVYTEESQVLAAEAGAWREAGGWERPAVLLRLRATARRALRLAEEFSSTVVALLVDRAREVGKAYGVAEASIRVLGEAEVRSHLVFQFARLATLLDQRVCHRLSLSSTEVIVPGEGVGTLTPVAAWSGFRRANDAPVLLLAEAAEGDEEIPPGVVGILLKHELPHLSHLAVRARQEGIVLATSQDAAVHAQWQERAGQEIRLLGTDAGVTLTARRAEAEPVRPGAAPTSAAILEIVLESAPTLIPLESARAANAGAKATAAARLWAESRRPNSGFRAPDGLVIPFGILRAALARIAGASPTALDLDTPATWRAQRERVRQLPVPAEIVDGLVKKFGAETLLMARSSASTEDLGEFAGAGLHDSVAGVTPYTIGPAVSQVWASLWNDRAVATRRSAGLGEDQAQMAVLVQAVCPAGYSFIAHTHHPVNGRQDVVYVEMVVGLGETLASGQERGSPYRFVAKKNGGDVELLAFANFSHAQELAQPQGTRRTRVDYARVALSRDPETLLRSARRVAEACRDVERSFGQPLDLEGVLAGSDVWIVQARPQQGTGARAPSLT